MHDRIAQLIDNVTDPSQPWIDMQRLTGISRQTWRAVYNGEQRVTQEILGSVVDHWPQYLFWLITGEGQCLFPQDTPLRYRWVNDKHLQLREGFSESVRQATHERSADSVESVYRQSRDEGDSFHDVDNTALPRVMGLNTPNGRNALHNRLVKMIDSSVNPRFPWKNLEQLSGIKAHSWRMAYQGRQRITADMFVAIGERWPQFICWLLTGLTVWAAVQTAPEKRSLRIGLPVL